MASESIDSEPIRARGIIVNYTILLIVWLNIRELAG